MRLGVFSSSAWIRVRGRVVLRFTIGVTLGLFGFSIISIYVNFESLRRYLDLILISYTLDLPIKVL